MGTEVLHHVGHATFVDGWCRVWLVADDQGFGLRVEELAAGAAVGEQLVAQVFQHALEFLPLDVGRCGPGAQPLQCFLLP